jgi:hypothetical protein
MKNVLRPSELKQFFESVLPVPLTLNSDLDLFPSSDLDSKNNYSFQHIRYPGYYQTRYYDCIPQVLERAALSVTLQIMILIFKDYLFYKFIAPEPRSGSNVGPNPTLL